MKVTPKPTFDGPIPGENYTADTRNYPWHRPPQYSGFDETVAAMLDRLNSEREGELIYSLLDLEVPVYLITSNFLMRHVMRGFIGIDMAILAAGPIARMIEIIAKGNNQTADMDTTDPKRQTITPLSLKLQIGGIEALSDVEGDTSPAKVEEDAAGGLMGVSPDEVVDVASDDEQAAMLGGDTDEEEIV